MKCLLLHFAKEPPMRQVAYDRKRNHEHAPAYYSEAKESSATHDFRIIQIPVKIQLSAAFVVREAQPHR